MHILFASSHPFIPQIAGGAQSSVNELAREFMRRGHRVSVLAGLTGAGAFGLRRRIALKATRGSAVVDDVLGYDVWRAWRPVDAVSEVCRAIRPDVAVMQSGWPVPLGRAFSRAGVPIVLYLRNVETDDIGGDPSGLAGCTFVANSAFTADWFRQRYGIAAEVIHPLFDEGRYRTDTVRDSVVFINPHPHKGLEVALGTAEACPEIPFLFVEAWSLGREERAALTACLSRLPNVTLLPRTADMRSIYSRARVVLVPSQWQEAFGRIAAEAHYSAIPVLASRIGGLTEAVGPGGILVAPDAPVAEWSAALRRMWHDEPFYDGLCEAAAGYSRRPALDRETQIDRLTAILERARSATRAPRRPALHETPA